MANQIIQIEAAILSTSEAAAMIDIPEDGVIEGLSWAFSGLGGAGVARYDCELSFGSTSALSSNDARQVLDVFSAFVGNAVAQAVNKFTLVSMEVGMGERIYLHITVNGTTLSTAALRICVHLKTKSGRTVNLRRR